MTARSVTLELSIDSRFRWRVIRDGGSETFETISHPLRIKVLKTLNERPMSFSELKRELGIKSIGQLDFHLKKLGKLVTVNEEGKYSLTNEGHAASRLWRP